jgi:hypothetical protein
VTGQVTGSPPAARITGDETGSEKFLIKIRRKK